MIVKRLKIRGEVIHRITLSVTARFLYVCLDDSAGDAGMCWSKQPTLCALLGLDVRSLRRAVVELTEAGYVRVARKKAVLEYWLSWAPAAPGGTSSFPQPGFNSVKSALSPDPRSCIPVRQDSAFLSELAAPIYYMNQNDEPVIERSNVRPVEIAVEKWTEVETDMRAWLRGYPGIRRLPPGPDLTIVRECLMADPDPREVIAELRRMSHARLEPERSWKWFPVVLGRRLARAERA